MTTSFQTEFRTLFEQSLRLPDNPDCQRCDAQLKHPLLPWWVGKDYGADEKKVLFVGKPHRARGGRLPGEILPSGIIDPSAEIESYWKEHWAYWRATRLIAENLFGEHGHDRIALTNLIKCTNVGASAADTRSTDRTTKCMADSCVGKLGVAWREIGILKPTYVVFYTFSMYRQLLEYIPDAKPGSIKDITGIDHRVPCGAKSLGWWDRKAVVPWAPEFRILVVGHPERMQRLGYVDRVTNWLQCQ